MNIKIKSVGVSCLIGDDYDRVFAALRKQFGEGEEQLFTERTPGYEYLQWELPGDGWKALGACDALNSQLVRKELQNRQKQVCLKFGNNQAMAQKILSVPDDNYVYYRYDETGRLLIRLTAWGYRYPERVGVGVATTNLSAKEQTEHVYVCLMSGGEPMPGKTLRLNGFPRTTGADGILEIGDLPIGYQFDLEVDGERRHIIVTSGQGALKIDLTVYAQVEVQVDLDGQPYAGAVVDVSYAGCNMQLTCDTNGCAVTKCPLDKGGSICTVTVGGLIRQASLTEGITSFVFELETQQPQPDEPNEDELKKEYVTEDKVVDDVIADKENITQEESEKKEGAPLDNKPDGGTGQDTQDKNLVIDPPLPPEPPQPPLPPELGKPTPWWVYLLEVLAALALALLIYATYLLAGGLLFYY